MKLSFRYLFFLFILSILANCARKGRPEGGPKDKTVPLLVTSNPPYETTSFSESNIRIYFDEYIILKDLNKELVVSPPLKNPPIITPQGSASKYINIKILDTLLSNTTYIFNFGNAVQDNNEGNKLEHFKYVFSTGNYIDSLITKGKSKDAFSNKFDKDISILLYRIDSSFNDSIIYKEKPNYVTNNLDSTNFQFSNLKKGKYLVVALKEDAKNYIFNPKTDKIGFLPNPIELPKDSIITENIYLFKELLPFKFKRGKEISKGKIIFGFVGEKKDFKVTLLSKTTKDFKSISKFETGKDTLNYWFTPFKADSLSFLVANNTFIDTITVKLRKKKTDSLLISSSTNSILHFRDTFFLKSNNPIIKIDTSKIFLLDKDTLSVKYRSFIIEKENKIAFLFDKKPKQKYFFKVLPKAISDIYSQQNDTLQYNFRTKELEDYGKIVLDLQNKKNQTVIIELITNNNILIDRRSISKSEIITFNLLEPKKYFIRVIIDSNRNKKWDTGNYLDKKIPEKVFYLDKILKVRANWNIFETFFIQ